MEESLVSVCVITYNSATTVEQTLESIYDQTYNNIELVISDDCSIDETIEVCRSWLDRNRDRFANVKLLLSEHNTGTTRNLNRCCRAAMGKWIKPIAGDDLLKPIAIDTFLKYCNDNACDVCVSTLDFFGDPIQASKKEIYYTSFYEKYSKLSQREKYKLLLSECLLPMPGMLISKKLLNDVNYSDETYAFAEEWPLYMKIFDAGVDIPYFPGKLVCYRCGNNTLSQGSNYDNSIKGASYHSAALKVTEDNYKFYKRYRRPRLFKAFRFIDVCNNDIMYKTYMLSSKKNKSKFSSFTINVLKYINPRLYINKIKSICGRNDNLRGSK